MADETLLVISGDGLPPFAARGITQTLEPINAAVNVRRTVNGGLVDLSPSQFKKYKTTIEGTDTDSPAFDAVDVGDTLTIDCVAELCYKTGGSPQRTVVGDSSRTANGFTFYRPRLTVIVTNKSQQTDEAGAIVSWTLEAEER